MDNLVLFQVAADLNGSLTGSVLREAREEDLHRFRLLFEHPDGNRSLLVSMRPESPWIGRPAGRWPGIKRGPSRFAALLMRSLGSALVERVSKSGPDRICRLDFSDGHSLVLELTMHRANIVLLGDGGLVETSLRRPPSAADRLAPGGAYALPKIPHRLLMPESFTVAQIDARVGELTDEGSDPADALRRVLFGIGRDAARELDREARSRHLSIGTVCRQRLDQVLAGEATPWYSGPSQAPLLLPWIPDGEQPDRPDTHPAAVAGRYHEDRERTTRFDDRVESMSALLRREIRRSADLSDKVQRDMERFADPDRFRIWGEAILAGIGVARRAGGQLLVPDPYHPDAELIAIPDIAGEPLPKVAGSYFARHRRAVRGLETARKREHRIAARLQDLNRFLDELSELAGQEPDGLSRLHDLEERMQHAGFAVGLVPTGRKRRGVPQPGKARLEGVRIFPREDRYDILVGRDGKSNARLTFKLAAPEDFWLHALNVTGAHVVIRNPEQKKKPSDEALRIAAAAAAWYSDARNDTQVDVQFTRRKYVRKVRKGAPGAVILKKFETIRVRPAEPEAPESAT
jgi:predicted ribosome quality control (RQC) complex YloA/Tae2 family protein